MSYTTDASAVEIANRFSTHPIETAEQQNACEAVATQCRALARFLDEVLPPGRYKALAFNALEESMHWAHAAIVSPTSEPPAPAFAAVPEPPAAPRSLRPGMPVSLAELEQRAIRRFGGHQE